MTMLLRASRLPIARQLASRSLHSSAVRKEQILDASPAQFEKAHSSSKLTLVDFYAEWCGPCKVLTPILKRVITDDTGADLLTINVDTEVELGAKFKIASLPTVIAFKDGVQVGKFVGSRNEAGVKDFLKNLQG